MMQPNVSSFLRIPEDRICVRNKFFDQQYIDNLQNESSTYRQQSFVHYGSITVLHRCWNWAWIWNSCRKAYLSRSNRKLIKVTEKQLSAIAKEKAQSHKFTPGCSNFKEFLSKEVGPSEIGAFF